jgi:hypothetical protein
MTDESRWDQDPPPDESLARLLGAGAAAAPADAVDWERLVRGVMRAAGSDIGRARGWMEVVAQWGRVAMAASIVAMLVSGFLLWQAANDPGAPETATAPESIAVARAASAYPDETAFASLVRTEHHDEFTTWGVR